MKIRIPLFNRHLKELDPKPTGTTRKAVVPIAAEKKEVAKEEKKEAEKTKEV